MQIIAQCPRCGRQCLFDSGAADRRKRCPHCRFLFKIPPLDDVPKAVKVIRLCRGEIFVDEQGNTYG